MSIVVFTEFAQEKFHKSSLEAVGYARGLAGAAGKKVVAVVFNNGGEVLQEYGADVVLRVDVPESFLSDPQIISGVLSEIVREKDAEVVVFGSSANARYFAPVLAGNLKAAYASDVLSSPANYQNFTVKRNVFSSKAAQHMQLLSRVKVIGLASNCFEIIKKTSKAVFENFQMDLPQQNHINALKTHKKNNKIPLEDAEIVVSGGRGLQSPENWNLIEQMAEILGGATACSKPVSDMGWRPHSEHVGQTGKTIACGLYIAVGISGAIQHVAGINGSKTKVVINKDSEAPFFKSADYGIVGDAFVIIPKLIEKIKKFKNRS